MHLQLQNNNIYTTCTQVANTWIDHSDAILQDKISTVLISDSDLFVIKGHWPLTHHWHITNTVYTNYTKIFKKCKRPLTICCEIRRQMMTAVYYTGACEVHATLWWNASQQYKQSRLYHYQHSAACAIGRWHQASCRCVEHLLVECQTSQHVVKPTQTSVSTVTTTINNRSRSRGLQIFQLVYGSLRLASWATDSWLFSGPEVMFKTCVDDDDDDGSG